MENTRVRAIQKLQKEGQARVEDVVVVISLQRLPEQNMLKDTATARGYLTDSTLCSRNTRTGGVESMRLIPFEEIMPHNTKRELSAVNAYSIKLDTLPFSILETDMFRRAFPDKPIFHAILEHLDGMRALLTSNTTRIVVQNLSSVSIRVDGVDQEPKILSSVGSVADMTPGSLLTLFQFPPEHYRLVHVNAVLDPRDAWYVHTISCQDRHWSSADVPVTPPRYVLRMHRGISKLTRDEETAMHAHNLLSIPCAQAATVVGRDAWSHAFGARFHSFPIRFMPRCQLLLRPPLLPPSSSSSPFDQRNPGGVELVNCGDVPVLVCDRWVDVGHTCPLQHGDKISWMISKDFYSLPLAYIVTDTEKALPLHPHNYTLLADVMALEFAPLLAQLRALVGAADMPPTMQRLFAAKTVARVELDDTATDAPVALMPTGDGRGDVFELQVFWRHPVVFALRRDELHQLPSPSDVMVQLLGIAASNAGSRTIHDHEAALSACHRLARHLGVSDLHPVPSNYFVQQASNQNLSECYPLPQPPRH
ncbi:hypothetical protein DYB25_003557 [Aphanomyces astaci]|uniref:Uncharacterized protein n=1 Tax=Aphanomyces astaci TaxID=112090 RepID=A0A397BF93_APHAT|nr:hypothetical protein DYB25_003557 [Aphanomyces astaci]